MNKLNEYKNRPSWIDTMTKEQQHVWYLKIKETLPLWNKITNGQTDEIEAAIRDYELRNNIS